jgi:hypothetical protein
MVAGSEEKEAAMRTSSRMGLASIGAAVALGCSAGAAAASRPTSEFLPPPDGLLDTSCGYEILVTFPVQQEYVKTFVDRNGDAVKVIITGHLVVTFTNTGTDESVTANISGPSQFDLVDGTFHQGGLTGGPVDGLPGLNLFAGQIDETGALRGHLFPSICDVLAPGD